jgi:hypothetical protein
MTRTYILRFPGGAGALVDVDPGDRAAPVRFTTWSDPDAPPREGAFPRGEAAGVLHAALRDPHVVIRRAGGRRWLGAGTRAAAPPPAPDRSCGWCGAPCPPEGGGGSFCSEACRLAEAADAAQAGAGVCPDPGHGDTAAVDRR